MTCLEKPPVMIRLQLSNICLVSVLTAGISLVPAGLAFYLGFSSYTQLNPDLSTSQLHLLKSNHNLLRISAILTAVFLTLQSFCLILSVLLVIRRRATLVITNGLPLLGTLVTGLLWFCARLSLSPDSFEHLEFQIERASLIFWILSLVASAMTFIYSIMQHKLVEETSLESQVVDYSQSQSYYHMTCTIDGCKFQTPPEKQSAYNKHYRNPNSGATLKNDFSFGAEGTFGGITLPVDSPLRNSYTSTQTHAHDNSYSSGTTHVQDNSIPTVQQFISTDNSISSTKCSPKKAANLNPQFVTNLESPKSPSRFHYQGDEILEFNVDKRDYLQTNPNYTSAAYRLYQLMHHHSHDPSNYPIVSEISSYPPTSLGQPVSQSSISKSRNAIIPLEPGVEIPSSSLHQPHDSSQTSNSIVPIQTHNSVLNSVSKAGPKLKKINGSKAALLTNRIRSLSNQIRKISTNNNNRLARLKDTKPGTISHSANPENNDEDDSNDRCGGLATPCSGFDAWEVNTASIKSKLFLSSRSNLDLSKYYNASHGSLSTSGLSDLSHASSSVFMFANNFNCMLNQAGFTRDSPRPMVTPRTGSAHGGRSLTSFPYLTGGGIEEEQGDDDDYDYDYNIYSDTDDDNDGKNKANSKRISKHAFLGPMFEEPQSPSSFANTIDNASDSNSNNTPTSITLTGSFSIPDGEDDDVTYVISNSNTGGVGAKTESLKTSLSLDKTKLSSAESLRKVSRWVTTNERLQKRETSFGQYDKEYFRRSNTTDMTFVA